MGNTLNFTFKINYGKPKQDKINVYSDKNLLNALKSFNYALNQNCTVNEVRCVIETNLEK